MIMWCSIIGDPLSGGNDGSESAFDSRDDVVGPQTAKRYKYKGHLGLDEEDFVFRSSRDRGFEFGTRRMRRVTCTPQQQNMWFESYELCAKTHPNDVYTDLKWFVSTELVEANANFLSEITSWNRSTSFQKILDYNNNLLRAATSVFVEPFLLTASLTRSSFSFAIAGLPSVPGTSSDDEEKFEEDISVFPSPSIPRRVKETATTYTGGLPPPPPMPMMFSPRSMNRHSPLRDIWASSPSKVRQESDPTKSVANLIATTSEFVVRDDVSVASLPTPTFNRPICLSRAYSADTLLLDASRKQKRRGEGGSHARLLSGSVSMNNMDHDVFLRSFTPSSSRVTTSTSQLSFFEDSAAQLSRSRDSTSLTTKTLDLVESNTHLQTENIQLREDNEYLHSVIAHLQQEVDRIEMEMQQMRSISPLPSAHDIDDYIFELPKPIEDLPPPRSSVNHNGNYKSLRDGFDRPSFDLDEKANEEEDPVDRRVSPPLDDNVPLRPPPPPPEALQPRHGSAVFHCEKLDIISRGIIDDRDGELTTQIVDDPLFWEEEINAYAQMIVSNMSSRRSLDGIDSAPSPQDVDDELIIVA